MLKRIGNIVIMVLLLVATSGIPITQHYCGPAKMSFSIYATPKACCNNQCDKCHNVFKFSKVNDVFEAGPSITAQSLTDSVTLLASFFISLSDNFHNAPLLSIINHQKPLTFEAGHSSASSGNFRC